MLEIFSVLDSINGASTLCGGIEIPNTLINLVATIIRLIKIVVPILLIIWGMIDFAKSVVSKKEEDIKKYQKAFISRLISAILVFLVVIIVQLIVNLLAGVQEKDNATGSSGSDIWSCSKKFIEGVGDVDVDIINGGTEE